MENQKVTPLKWGGANLQDVIRRMNDCNLASPQVLQAMLMVILSRECGSVSRDPQGVVHVGKNIKIQICDYIANLAVPQTSSTWNLLTEMAEMVFYIRAIYYNRFFDK